MLAVAQEGPRKGPELEHISLSRSHPWGVTAADPLPKGFTLLYISEAEPEPLARLVQLRQ